jgi:pre-mRNA-splicing helicase BRR2
MEIVLSRMRFISAERNKKNQNPMRLIAMCNSIANAKDIGEWLGAKEGIFHFHPSVRPQPMEIRVQGFEINDFGSRMLAMSKPVYNSIVNNTRTSFSRSGFSSSSFHQKQHPPVIVFVPSSKQAQLSAIDLITFALAENDPYKFVPSKRRRHTGKTNEVLPLDEDLPGEKDSALEETLAAGVGYIHDAQSMITRSFVLNLYAKGLIQVLVVPHTLCWDLVSAQTQAFMVAIMGTQYYDGKEHRYVDYQLADVLQMTKFANRRSVDTMTNGSILKCAIFCHTSKKKFFAKFLYDPLPVESQLEHFLSDHINAEIVNKTIENKQEAVDYLTWTLMYRRLMKNPNYYNLPGATQVHLSDHLSELVENTVTSLEESRCIQVTEEEDGMESLSPLNLGMIAAYYYIKYTTIELFACSLTATTKMKGLIHILASASEFNELPSRFGEDLKLERLAKHLKYPMIAGSNGVLDYSQPHVKANVLLQMHFNKQHQQLSAALRKDLDFVLKHAVRLIHGMVDVISSNGWLRPALAAMDLCQMVVQAQWNTDSPLMQVPFFTQEIISTIKKECEAAKEDEVETPLDILSMDDDVRKKALPFPIQKMSAIAKFCNAYPDVDVETEIEDENDITTGSTVTLKIQLARSSEEEEEEEKEKEIEEEDQEEKELGIVNACHYPVKKAENWWVVLGDAKKNILLSIKRVPLTKSANLQLDFAAPDAPGQYTFQLYVICDGYAGCDLENEIKIKVLEGEDDDDNDDEEEDAEGMDTED